MSDPKPPYLSVVSPVFNEQRCLPELLQQLSEVLSSLDPHYEIILVDDGSQDGSWHEIEAAGALDPRVKGLRFSRNFGHHIAIAAGLDYADGEWVVVMDSDLQDPPQAILDLHAEALKGYDVVVARRRNRTDGFVKVLLSKAFHCILSRLMGTESNPREGVFRIIHRPAVRVMRQMRERSRFFVAMADWVGFRKSFIEVAHGVRYAGETKYPLRKQVALATSAILSFSEKPLELAMGLGTVFAASGILYAVIIVIRALCGNIAVQGYASLFSAVLVVGGCGIMTTALVGLYVGQIFQQVKGRPLYVLSELVGRTERTVADLTLPR
jgi:glycosyltransferase involved in cell wall biosynthesis